MERDCRDDDGEGDCSSSGRGWRWRWVRARARRSAACLWPSSNRKRVWTTAASEWPSPCRLTICIAQLHSGNTVPTVCSAASQQLHMSQCQGSTYPLVTKHQSMSMEISNCQGRVVSQRVYDHFPPAHFQSRLHVILSVDGCCATCHLNGYPKACSLEHVFQIQL